MKLYLFLFILLIVATQVDASSGKMKLLAVSESESGFVGSSADLYLQITRGTGRVFIDSYPLTKVDTQISTRFAQQIACEFLEISCDNKDFFYTIRADSSIIGGPSAGAAIAALTVSVLDDQKVIPGVSITGTINSGGLIGPVSGILAKIDAAEKANLQTVLIPFGESTITNATNHTINATLYGANKSLLIREVLTLSDAVYYLTGKEYKHPVEPILIDEQYQQIMKGLAESLCNRTYYLADEITAVDNNTKDLIGIAENLTEKSRIAYLQNSYYASASYCFGANTKYSQIKVISNNLTEIEILDWFSKISKEILLFETQIKKKGYTTLPELQAFMIVEQRLLEAKDSIKSGVAVTNSTDYSFYLAYAIERLQSAVSWSQFFQMKGSQIEFNEDIMRESCLQKLSEAQERYQYVQVFFPGFLEDTKKALTRAQFDANNKDYELCLFKANKAKAEANSLLGVLGVEPGSMAAMLDQKLIVANREIAKDQESSAFPIIGYSYYEYAKDLKGNDLYSAWLYTEYALELSNMDMYFKEKNVNFQLPLNESHAWIFILGICIGLAIGLYLNRQQKIISSK